MESKNGIQKRSPQHRVRCHKAASSGEAMHLLQVRVACIVRSHPDAQLIHLRCHHLKPAGVSASHLKEVKDWFGSYKSETARSIY